MSKNLTFMFVLLGTKTTVLFHVSDVFGFLDAYNLILSLYEILQGIRMNTLERTDGHGECLHRMILGDRFASRDGLVGQQFVSSCVHCFSPELRQPSTQELTQLCRLDQPPDEAAVRKVPSPFPVFRVKRQIEPMIIIILVSRSLPAGPCFSHATIDHFLLLCVLLRQPSYSIFEDRNSVITRLVGSVNFPSSVNKGMM